MEGIAVDRYQEDRDGMALPVGDEHGPPAHLPLDQPRVAAEPGRRSACQALDLFVPAWSAEAQEPPLVGSRCRVLAL